MNLVEARGLYKDWDGTPLFEDVTFSIGEGEKLGLVGANGTGKSSLLGILSGDDEDFRGSLKRKPGLRIGYARQRWEPPAGPTGTDLLSARAEELQAELEEKGEALGNLEGRALEEALGGYGELRAEYERWGAEEARERAARLLERLGLPEAADTEAARLSGGEKNVLALALALMGDPELLVLDEPGNHLDFAGLDWLESFIRGERRAVLVVSHNRWLLDRAVDGILDIDGNRITRYSGGFSRYRVAKLKDQAGQGRDFEAGRREVERLEALVRRFEEIARSRPDPSWGKRLRARRSQLERARADAVDRPEGPGRRIELSFNAVESKADFALVVKGYDKAYGGLRLFEDASLDLLVGERAALVGANGSGKTSLIRDIVAASGSLEGGAVRVGPSMRIGYCSQHEETLDAERSVGELFRAAEAGSGRDADIEKLLRRFLFGRGILDRRMGSLSGGERKRLEIALACHTGANFLVLDEPTNHLDIAGREALEEGLSGFGGSILLVSHDRWFLESVAERVILVRDRKLVAYEGSFSEYWRDEGRGAAAMASAGGRRQKAGIETRAAELGRQGKSATDRAAALEARIGEEERRKLELEGEAARALARGDYKAAAAFADKAQSLQRLVERLYEEWARTG